MAGPVSSGGGPSSHRGVDHPYHGEACSLPWTAILATEADASRGRLLLGYLSRFDEGAASVENDDLDLVCTLYWRLDVFPYAWLWQEFGATTGAPWFGRAFTMATDDELSGIGPRRVGTTATHGTLDAGAAVDTEPRLRLAPVELA